MYFHAACVGGVWGRRFYLLCLVVPNFLHFVPFGVSWDVIGVCFGDIMERVFLNIQIYMNRYKKRPHEMRSFFIL